MPHAVYLDHNATTPVAPEVLEAMLPWLCEHHGNPSSAHGRGVIAAAAVAQARAQLASLLNGAPEEIVFTGCATEASNLALCGVALALERAGSPRRHLAITAVEHPAVAEPAAALRERGWRLDVVPVDREGRVATADMAAALADDTALVSVMHSNNEVGTLQPVAEIARAARARGVLVHSDAAQSVGKLPLDVQSLGVDLLTVAGHKFGAPKGVGALWVRRGTPIAAVLRGAGQEHGLRPGTENVAGIVALGAAAALATRELPALEARLRERRDELHARLSATIPGLMLNGHATQRLPGTLNVSFPGISGRALLAAVEDEVHASVGSACHSEGDAVSGVLAAMGLDARRAMGAVRLSVGRSTTADEVERAAAALAQAWRALSGHS